MIEAAGDQSIDYLTTIIFNQIMCDEVIPIEWRLSYVIELNQHHYYKTSFIR